MGQLLGLRARLRSLSWHRGREDSLHIGTKCFFCFVLNCEIGISIPLYLKKIQQNCASGMESCAFFVWVFWVYFNLQRFSFVPLLSLALIPFLLPLQELVLLIFSLGRWAVVSVVNSKGQSTWKRQVWSGSLPMISLCLPTESSVPLQPPNPLFVWTKSVGWSKNLKYLKLKGGVNKGCLASSPPRF